MEADGLDRRKVTLAAEKAEMTHRQLQEALARCDHHFRRSRMMVHLATPPPWRALAISQRARV